MGHDLKVTNKGLNKSFMFASFRYFLVFMAVIVTTQGQVPFKLQVTFDESATPEEPDYALQANWSALPEIKDLADEVPKTAGVIDRQEIAKADVFYIYPTIFTSEPKDEYQWNENLKNEELNALVDNSAILNQCSAFNGSCKVYAPRYRQAHYSAFTTTDKVSAKKSLDLAYDDVKKAFEYYMENHNDGRPIVIAGHSQGTLHAQHLLKDFFDGKELQNQLVEAYLIGMPIKKDYFENIEASNSPGETGGFVTWNTFHTGFYPSYYGNGLNEAVCTNPLTWKTDETYASRKLNTGGIGLKFKFVKSPVDAQVKDGLLWINKPYILGRMFIKTKIWHRADINLYWMNIRENVALRVDNFTK
jgi:hypothetical protein